MKILCLFVRYGATAYPRALETLDRWYANHALLGDRTLWVIDNALPSSSPGVLSVNGASLLPGDNRAWEFSAWSRTLREFRAEASGFDAIHFVTSAFNTLYTDYLMHFRADMLAFAMSREGCLGHIDSYNLPVEIAGHSSASWIRTCFFFLPAERALRLETWARFDDPADFFAGPDSTEFRSDAPISTDYQHRIRTWLIGDEVGGNRWHSPIRHGREEAVRFQRKTLAIVNEHHLSINLRQMGVPLIDFCWLWSDPSGPAYSGLVVPDERSQLAVRRRILGIPD